MTFTHDRNPLAIGFIYKAILPSGLYYIGSKLYDRKITRRPLKGKTRKRHSIKESDWRTYRSSNSLVQKEAIEFHLVRECFSKSELNMFESYYITSGWINNDGIINSWFEKCLQRPKR